MRMRALVPEKRETNESAPSAQQASERLVIGADDATKMATAMIRAEVRDRTPTVGERRLPFLASRWPRFHHLFVESSATRSCNTRERSVRSGEEATELFRRREIRLIGRDRRIQAGEQRHSTALKFCPFIPLTWQVHGPGTDARTRSRGLTIRATRALFSRP